MKKQKILKAQCVHCGKPVYSLYERQLKYNVKQHEENCVEKTKGDRGKSLSDVPHSQS